MLAVSPRSAPVRVRQPMESRRRVTLIPGDGVGPDVVAAARDVLDVAGADLDWDIQLAGARAASTTGVALPDEVVESIRANGVALKGPTATGTRGERSVSVRLREQLDLYAGIRPCRALPGTQTAFPGTDLVVIRMTQEDLYAGVEFSGNDPRARMIRSIAESDDRPAIAPDSAISLKLLSPGAARRFFEFALEWARGAGRRRVTIVHKATVMRATDGLFLSIGREVAASFPELEVDDVLIDAACLALVRCPEPYDVLVMPVQYGDIVSDLAAGLVGGVGVVPGANIGDEAAVFEPVHGTARRLDGLDRANPMAMILTGAMLARHLGKAAVADRIEDAVAQLSRRGRPLTYDLLGCSMDSSRAASTGAVVQALIEILEGDALLPSGVAARAR